jgi:repressor LexA
MQAFRVSTASLLRRLNGCTVSEVVLENGRLLRVHFSDGATLLVSAGQDGLAVDIAIEPAGPEDSSQKPTERQREYLTFIARYIQRFGRAPAESDIRRHFLVSAPTVNQMMQMLERRGFITRQPGVPRSIRLHIDITPA